MMKMRPISIVLGLFFLTSSIVNGASSDNEAEKLTNSARQQEIQVEENEYKILDRNEIDDTDVLAIPFDDSEVEDEEEVNRIEGKELFKLPKPPQ